MCIVQDTGQRLHEVTSSKRTSRHIFVVAYQRSDISDFIYSESNKAKCATERLQVFPDKYSKKQLIYDFNA